MHVLPHAKQCLKILSKSVEACQRYDGKSSQKCPVCDGFSVTFESRNIVYLHPKLLQDPVTGILYFNYFWVPI